MLLQGIKQATGLTSGQLNSNVELQLWLNSVTDPTQPFETVQFTLGNLDKILVTDPAVRAANWKRIKSGQRGPEASGPIAPPPAGGAPAAPAAARSPQDAQALEWANKNPGDPRAVAIKQRLGVQ
jgi:hypothetical protein